VVLYRPLLRAALFRLHESAQNKYEEKETSTAQPWVTQKQTLTQGPPAKISLHAKAPTDCMKRNRRAIIYRQ
jgi:hypothetical protein